MGLVVWVVPLLPLISALAVSLIRNEDLFPRVSTALTGATFLVSGSLLFLFPKGLNPSLGLNGDSLGLLLATYILLVSLVVHKYSEKYMADEEGYRRFFILLDLMTSCLTLLVLADNIILLLFSWHLVGFLLYMLLSHNYRRREAVKYANLTFFTHRLADLPLLGASLLLVGEMGTYSLSEMFERAEFVNKSVLSLVTLLVTLSAMLKSAQFLFHHWIVYTMEGPTPVSALMHAGIVNAGAFIVNRFAPLYPYDTFGLQLAFIAGSITAIVGSILMLMQSDIKKSLGYSTVGQMGYMIMELGVGAFALAVYHMMAHGIFKATLFLYSGNVIHSARHDPNIPEDEVYTALKKRERIAVKVPWIVYGLITVAVPLLIVLFTHYLVEEKFFEYKSSLVLLFFGWVTAAQVLVSVFRLGRDRPILTALLAILSLVVVLFGYVLIGHSLQNFLYPNKELVSRIYDVAFTSWWLFLAEILFMVVVIGVGWIFIYYASKEVYLPFYMSLYTHFSRELYIHDIYELAKNAALSFARWIFRFRPLPSVAAGLLALFFLSKGDIPLFLYLALISVAVPLFPVSVGVSHLIRRFGGTAVVILSVGALLVIGTIGDKAESFQFLAAFTFLFHSVRLFAAGSLKEGLGELYPALMSLLWIDPSLSTYLLLVLPIAFLSLGRLAVMRFYLTDDLRFAGAVIRDMPLYSVILVLGILLSYSVPLKILFGKVNVPEALMLWGIFFLAVSGVTGLLRILWSYRWREGL